jgi:hypothetical protein
MATRGPFRLSTNGTIVSPVSLAYAAMLVVSQQEAKPFRTSPGGLGLAGVSVFPVLSAGNRHNVSPGVHLVLLRF